MKTYKLAKYNLNDSIKIKESNCNNSMFDHIDYDQCFINKDKFFSGYEETLNYIKKKNMILPSLKRAQKNIPKINNKNCKETVLGPLELILPYVVLNDQYNILSMSVDIWTIELNYLFLCCSIKKKLPNQINCNYPIRLLLYKTINKSIYDKTNKLRVTGKELCVLMNKYKIKTYIFHDGVTRDHHIIFIKTKPNNKNIKKIYTSDKNIYLFNDNAYTKLHL
jgi:hypothetical protein